MPSAFNVNMDSLPDANRSPSSSEPGDTIGITIVSENNVRTCPLPYLDIPVFNTEAYLYTPFNDIRSFPSVPNTPPFSGNTLFSSHVASPDGYYPSDDDTLKVPSRAGRSLRSPSADVLWRLSQPGPSDLFPADLSRSTLLSPLPTDWKDRSPSVYNVQLDTNRSFIERGSLSPSASSWGTISPISSTSDHLDFETGVCDGDIGRSRSPPSELPHIDGLGLSETDFPSYPVDALNRFGGYTEESRYESISAKEHTLTGPVNDDALLLFSAFSRPIEQASFNLVIPSLGVDSCHFQCDEDIESPPPLTRSPGEYFPLPDVPQPGHLYNMLPSGVSPTFHSDPNFIANIDRHDHSLPAYNTPSYIVHPNVYNISTSSSQRRHTGPSISDRHAHGYDSTPNFDPTPAFAFGQYVHRNQDASSYQHAHSASHQRVKREPPSDPMFEDSHTATASTTSYKMSRPELPQLANSGLGDRAPSSSSQRRKIDLAPLSIPHKDPKYEVKRCLHRVLVESPTRQDADERVKELARDEQNEEYLNVFQEATLRMPKVTDIGIERSIKRRKTNKRFCCILCRAEVTANDNLQNHYRSHLDFNEFDCRHCRRYFRTTSILTRHERDGKQCLMLRSKERKVTKPKTRNGKALEM